jgi:hypothetical protein
MIMSIDGQSACWAEHNWSGCRILHFLSVNGPQKCTSRITIQPLWSLKDLLINLHVLRAGKSLSCERPQQRSRSVVLGR